MKITDNMIIRAVSKAVQLNILPKYYSLAGLEGFKNKMKKILEAALSDVFDPGDVIEYNGDWFTVLENHGVGGVVKEYPDGEIVEPFYWEYEDMTSSLVMKSQEVDEKQDTL